MTDSPGRLKLIAPLSGLMLPLADVPDPTFAQKMVGDGVSIDPVSEFLLAPIGGKVTLLHKAHHALTITTDEGLEILIHIGLETVGLKGEGFTPKVAEGARVAAGDPLIAFDAALLSRRAASLLTQMVISNGDMVTGYHPATGHVEAGKTVVLELDLAEGAASAGAAGADDGIVGNDIVILNPNGFHARPTAVLANSAKRYTSDIKLLKGAQEANAKSVVSVMSLDVQKHDKVRVKAAGPDAAEAIEVLSALIESGLGESLHDEPKAPAAPPPPPPVVTPSDDPNLLRGVSASPGLATGRIFQLRNAEITVKEAGQGEAAEKEALNKALASSKKELEELHNQLRRSADVGKAAIFAAHQELLEDPELLSQTAEGMAHGQSAAFAWRAAFQAQAETLKKMKNELLAGRANDIRDVGRRVLEHLTGEKASTVEIPPDSILIAEELTPSDTASLDRRKVLGFCTTGGGATSHVAILARSAGLPAIAAIEGHVLDIPNGTLAILDGTRAELRLNPDEAEMTAIKALQAEAKVAREKELAVAAEAAITQDGQRIKVVANISGLAEAEESVTLGGEGVGLLRSEFLFLQRSDAPGEDEQAAVYTAVAKALGPERDLVVRTLDVGGDKPLAYLPMPPEINPFLGVRGIRLNLLGAELLTSQVRAILESAPYTNLCIMFPMVSSIEEVREAKAIVLAQKAALGITANVQVGIMVEVPSAAVLAAGLAAEVDFFSIGTNDLTQYTLAIDRGHPRLAKMADGLHPAVLSLIDQTVKGAHQHGKWVGVCGGLAGETAAIPILVGLGVDELSVSVSALPAVKAAVRRLRLSDCRELATRALSLLSATEVRSLAANFLADQK